MAKRGFTCGWIDDNPGAPNDIATLENVPEDVKIAMRRVLTLNYNQAVADHPTLGPAKFEEHMRGETYVSSWEAEDEEDE
jgi:hypothetical protein